MDPTRAARICWCSLLCFREWRGLLEGPVLSGGRDTSCAARWRPPSEGVLAGRRDWNTSGLAGLLLSMLADTGPNTTYKVGWCQIEYDLSLSLFLCVSLCLSLSVLSVALSRSHFSLVFDAVSYLTLYSFTRRVTFPWICTSTVLVDEEAMSPSFHATTANLAKIQVSPSSFFCGTCSPPKPRPDGATECHRGTTHDN